MSSLTSASSPPGSVDQAQADVDRIRADLAATVDALVAKADVAGRAKESAAHLTAQGRQRIEAAGERVTPQTIAIGVGSAVLVVAAVLVGRRR
jgi:hypothetical protein